MGEKIANLVNMQKRMSSAHGHGLDHGSTFHRLVRLRIDQIQYVN